MHAGAEELCVLYPDIPCASEGASLPITESDPIVIEADRDTYGVAFLLPEQIILQAGFEQALPVRLAQCAGMDPP